ncbi:hypothetical protein MF271_01825 (plasmid) [Deinococcus sp. KNUC1210]|uniref:hypothetical protein n=1 Tax=Deinococcus sp. KNUC1210 TaxID=2917691 RepID=UPI001EF0B988|nr:hypothetical protein [Deinococcus sp. KNUC1210]ULH14283.1 hypothetical protein MF271_01825 [Deinococcus sp. KNUC1210]
MTVGMASDVVHHQGADQEYDQEPAEQGWALTVRFEQMKHTKFVVKCQFFSMLMPKTGGIHGVRVPLKVCMGESTV